MRYAATGLAVPAVDVVRQVRNAAAAYVGNAATTETAAALIARYVKAGFVYQPVQEARYASTACARSLAPTARIVLRRNARPV